MKLTSYSASQIATILGVEHSLTAPDSLVSNLLIDSRKGHQFENSLFIAIMGDFRDGHQFVDEMYQKGVRNFLVSKPVKELPGANVFQVENTLDALQNLAIAQRNSRPIPVIGITGSNGKTIVKEWLYQLLHEDYKIVRSPKSYNSQIGVPLSVWRMNSNYNLAIFEAGISKMNEMVRLEKMIQPTIGVFTNIGLAHQENFENVEQKVIEKIKLFKSVDCLIFCGDSKELSEVIESQFSRAKQFIWGSKKGCDLQITEKQKLNNKTVVTGVFNQKNLSISIPFLDDASIENALHCWAYMLFDGIPNTVIQNRFYHLEPIAMRLEQKSGIDGSVIINDAYNADPTALEIALDYLGRVNRTRKTVILSDILQTGESSEVLYNRINMSLRNHNVRQFIGIGEKIFENQNQFTIPNQHFFLNTQRFLDHIHAFSFNNEAILIKGARKFQFEQITAKLAQKTHQTQLEINLDSIKHNLHFYRTKVNKGVKIMVMVKAYGYGAGGPEIARLLATQDVDYLGVAYADEGVAIRKAGVTTPIMVMNPSEEAFDTMINYNLEPEIYSLEVFNAYNQVLSSEGMLCSSYKIHLKLDTGMNRLGFCSKDINEILSVLKSEKHFKIASVFSHLAASDDAQHDAFTQSQIQKFVAFSQKIEDAVGYSFIRHIANSAAIERFDNTQFDMVRLGIGLYGVASKFENQNQLQSVSSLFSIVIQVKNVKKGESIGYNRSFFAPNDMKIAIIPIGYADGLDRRLGNGVGSVFLSGHKRPILGNICMDIIMVDITGLKTQVNERVEIFGNNIAVQEIASRANTISYEILSSIPPRVKRVYIKEDS